MTIDNIQEPVGGNSSAFNQDSLFCYGDAMQSKAEPLVCTMRLYKPSIAPQSADLFDVDAPAEPVEVKAKAFHRFYSLSDIQNLEFVLAGAQDAYISQGTFDTPKRREVNIASIQTLFVDLDIYNVGKTVSETVADVSRMFDAIGIDEGAVSTVSSGRGMYLKLPLSESVDKQELHRWKRVQRAVVDYLAPLGSDPKVKDASRVLRAVGSINSKSGNAVDVIQQANKPMSLNDVEARLEEAGLFSPAMARQARNSRAGRKGNGVIEQLSSEENSWASGFSPFDLTKFGAQIAARQGVVYEGRRTMLQRKYQEFCWKSLADIDRVAALRGGKFGAGMRDASVFWSLVLLAQAGLVSPENFWVEVCALSTRTAGYYNPLEDGTLNSLLSRLCDATAFGKDSLYLATKDRLMDELNVTSDEEREMSVLVSVAEYNRRIYQSKCVAKSFEGIRGNERSFLARLDKYIKQERLSARNEKRAERLSQKDLAQKMRVDARTIRRYLTLLGNAD